MTTDTLPLVREIGTLLQARGWRLACAESCTGGLASHLLTEQPGSSAWFLGAVVAYSNDAKSGLLFVPADVLATQGAVSREAVLAMAEGARRAFGAECSLAVSGIAGPTGGTPDKPVGTVWMAWTTPSGTSSHLFRLAGSRSEIKAYSARKALEGLLDRLRHATRCAQD
jgi:nicotinamide-nucleotide amidase